MRRTFLYLKRHAVKNAPLLRVDLCSHFEKIVAEHPVVNLDRGGKKKREKKRERKEEKKDGEEMDSKGSQIP